MSDFEKLKLSVIKQSQEKGARQWQEEKNRLEAEFEQAKQQLLQEKEAYREAQLKQLNRIYQRDEQQLRNKERQSTLTSKQNVLEELFQAAKDSMANWSEQEEYDFLSKVLAQYQGQNLSLVLGELTAIKLSESSRTLLKNSYPNITWSTDEIRQTAGFILSDGLVDYHYLYDTLVDSVWNEESYRIAEAIFVKE